MLLKCLSIQQPFANWVMWGRKPVENRGRTWLKDRDWQREGPVLLGIHASRRLTSLNEIPVLGWWKDPAEWPVGVVLGVVDVRTICCPDDLPADVQGDPHVIDDAENWCWVLDNPRALKEFVPAPGQAWLFNVNVPDKLLPAGVVPNVTAPPLEPARRPAAPPKVEGPSRMTHRDLNDSQKALLSELYAEANCKSSDNLPYTEAFERLYSQFLIGAGVSLHRHFVWKALCNVRKAGKLDRKVR
jgi:hypothetical protein